MSYETFFSMSSGLAKPLRVPQGTKAAILSHIEEVEKTLGLKRTKYEDNPVHWDHFDPEFRAGFPSVADELLCETVAQHNKWVHEIYAKFAHWGEKPFTAGKGHQGQWPETLYPVGHPAEEITPEDAAEFWHGFQELTVEPARWTAEYYRSRMEHLYEVMRGRESEGVTFDVKALTPKQAAQVINIFSTYLDTHDLRLDVPKDRDYLASSYDGGYSWCEKCCQAIAEDDLGCRRRKCPIRAEREGE